MNSQLIRPRPNYYKIVDLLQDQEVLIELDFKKSNIGKLKIRRTKENLKDKQFEVFKLKYVHGEIDSINFFHKIFNRMFKLFELMTKTLLFILLTLILF